MGIFRLSNRDPNSSGPFFRRQLPAIFVLSAQGFSVFGLGCNLRAFASTVCEGVCVCLIWNARESCWKFFRLLYSVRGTRNADAYG